MEMHQVRYFLAVARLLNFTRAAEHCNVTQPSLTRAIQKLEDEFGGALFNRERSLTHLTELGRMVLPHLEQTYEAAEAATMLAGSIGRAEVTPLVMGVARGVSSPALDEILGRLTEMLPGLTVELRGGSSAFLIDEALKGGIDLLLVALPDQATERLQCWPLYDHPYAIGAHPAHAACARGRLSLIEAADEAWIDGDDDGAAMWRAELASAGIAARFPHRADTADLTARLVASGLGLAVLPGDMRITGVAMLDLADHPLSVPIALCCVAGRRRGRAAEAFLRAARARDWTPVYAGAEVSAATAASTA